MAVNSATMYVDDIGGRVEVRYDTQFAPQGFWAGGFLVYTNAGAMELLDPGDWAQNEGRELWEAALKEARQVLLEG